MRAPPPLTHSSREAIGLAARDVAGEKILERGLFGEESGEEEPLDQSFRDPMEAVQRVSGGSVPGRTSLGRLRMASVSSPVLAGVRAAVRQVAVDVRDDVRGLVVAEAVLAVRGLLQEPSERTRVIAIAEHPEGVLQNESLGPQPEDQANGGSPYGVRGLEIPRGRGLGS